MTSVVLATAGCISGSVAYIGAEHVSCATVGRLRRLGNLSGTRCDEGRPRDVASLVSDPLVLLNAEVPSLPGGVTKIFHQIALCSPSAYGCSSQDSRRLSGHMWSWVESWNRVHKGWLHVFWTDVEVRRLLEDRYPEALDLFERYPHAVMRADMARAYILSAFGGVYADTDYEALSSIEPFILGHGLCMLDSPYKKWEDVQNSLMASRPGHPFWAIVFRLLHERQPKMLQFEVDVLQATGPRMLSDALAEYERTGGAGAAADGECRFEVDRLMFGMNTSDGPGAAVHHYAHSWDTEDTRDDIRRISGCIVVVCAFVLLGLWRCVESHKQFVPWWAAG